MEALEAFLPVDRRIALSAGALLPDIADGAVLFADIAGFTPLTEGLARELGPQRGPEELTSYLNQVFTGLIEAVHRYHGSVIGFGGDAITCWFPDDDGIRAVTSALAIHAAMRRDAVLETPAGTRFELAIKVAIATGPVRRFVVGDPDLRQIDAMAGGTLDAMAAAEGAAERGETIVTTDTAAALGDRVTIAAVRPVSGGESEAAVIRDVVEPAGPEPWSVAGGELLEAAESERWVWPSVHARVGQLRGGFLSELRPVVALFLHFGGIDYDGDSDAGAKLDAYVRAVEVVLDDHGGTLLELSFGDKGSHVYAGFGAPTASADDASSAIGAALALLETSRDWAGIRDVRIGLARGPMRTGAYGGPTRAAYSVMGDRTNLAARLMSAAAPGEVLCDDAVRDRASRLWELEALPAIRVKGKADPIEVFRPNGARAAVQGIATARGDLLGRQEELAQLEAALADARSGGQRLIGVVGEGGIGKSRLVAELVSEMREAGLRCSVGAGQSIEQHTPYRAWRDVLNEGLDLTDLDDPADRRRRVETRLAANSPEKLDRAPLLDDILGLGWADNPLTAGLDPALRRDSLVDLVVGLLREWGRAQPCLLVLDDAQWLDDLSWELVVAVARGLAATRTPFLMVLALRPPDPASAVHRHLESIEAQGMYESLPLGGLGPEATVALVAQRLQVAQEAVPEPVAALVRERAEGNPFFAEELVLALQGQDVLRVEPDPHAPDDLKRRRCVVDGDLDAARQDLPTDVQGLVLARIDRLPPESQVVMKMASVIGRTFALAPLEHALSQTAEHSREPEQSREPGRSPGPAQSHDLARSPDPVPSREATLAALAQLERHDLAVLEATLPDRIYAFNHIITQETAYGTLLYQQRRSMHRTVAGWYEWSHGAGDGPPPDDGLKTLEPYYPLLTHHYNRAEDQCRERVYARLAGEQAASQYANADALRYLTRALDITEPDDAATRLRILGAREMVYNSTGDRSAQAEDVVAIAALAAGTSNEDWQREGALRRANLALVSSDLAAAVEAAEESLRNAGELDVSVSTARGRIVWGKAEWQRGNYELAREQLDEAARLASATSSVLEAAEAQVNLAAVHRHLQDHAEARRQYETALASYREIGDKGGETACLVSLAVIAGERGEFGLAQRLGEQALALCRLIGHRRGLSIIEGNMGADLFDLGDYAGAAVHLESALLACRELGDRWGEAISLDTLGLVRHRQGDATARERLAAALAIQRDIDDQHGIGYTLTHVGDVEADLGALESAEEAHEEALALRRELGQDALTMDNLSSLARIALDRDQLGEARSRVDAVLEWIDANGTDGMEFPVLVEWTCHMVLDASGPGVPADADLAAAALERAHALVQERAEGIADAAVRRTFLSQVPFNRDVEEACAAANASQCAPEAGG